MSPDPHVPLCPRCGAVMARDGSLCLRCAGLRVLRLESSGAGGAPLDDNAEQIGPYAVIEELGRGGMGRVVAASQPGLGRVVAVKTMRAGVAPELDLRFLREVQTLSRLRHPHIVAVHDTGRTADHLYFSMDYIEGGDLATRLRGGALPPQETVSLLRKVADALAYLHSQGVLHRDLKPSNILLDGAEPKLADFGLAAQLESGGDLTALTRVLGTPHYLAPEALLKGSGAYSVASDLYSFGVVLYELLTGRTPFAGASPEGLLNLLHDSEAPSPRALVPSLPRDLEVVCLKCLDRDPAKRYTSARALEEDLGRFQSGQPILARPLSRGEHLLRWARRRPQLAAVWALSFAIAAVATTAAARIAREQARTETALAEATAAGMLARQRLREARLAEAKAVVHTVTPGRRAQALAALREASSIRPGTDLRDAAVAALTTIDAEPADTWDLQVVDPAEVAFSPDGRIAAIRARASTDEGTNKRAIQLKERGQPALLGEIQTSADILGPLEFSADGGFLASRLEDASVRVWSLRPVALGCSLEDRPLPGRAARRSEMCDYAFDPTGPRLAVGRHGGGLDLLAMPAGRPLASWVAPLVVQSVKFSPDGRWLAAARLHDTAAGKGVLLDATDLHLVGTLPVAAEIDGLVWAADGRSVGVITNDNACTWFSVPDGHRLQRIVLPGDAVLDVIGLEANNDLALRPSGSSAILIDADYGRPELSFTGLGSSSLRGVEGGRAFLTTAFTNIATFWRPIARTGWRVFPSLRSETIGAGFGPCAVDLSPDGRWFATADGTFVALREAARGRLAALVEIEQPAYVFSSLLFSADGTHLLRCSNASGLQSFPLSPARETVGIGTALPLEPIEGFLLSSATPDRRVLALVNTNTGLLRLVRVDVSGTRIESCTEWSVPGAYSAALSPDGAQLLVNCTGVGPEAAAQRLRVYRTADGAVLRELPAQACGEATWSTDGSTAMTSNGLAASTVWNTADWTPRCTLGDGHGGNATTFALSGDGRTAVVFHDNWLHLFATADGAPIVRLELRDANGFCLGLRETAPGRFAAVQIDGRIDLLDTTAWNTELTKLGLGW
ncbi:MAG TPA: WD40 repeat domain-containing serine/threonine protein kinase [Opitutaceae bacterium]|nr:WD40 repeat domain-containing serine/threonine protein kinase [Opitutaceae bacterium]